MMSCTELITMCLLSAKQLKKDKPIAAPMQLTNQDLSIFQDIFRRADKNDDGKLSFEEFQSYFCDGVLNKEDLHKMFIRIDKQQTNNMDTERICDYFSEHLGEYKNVLTALQNLNVTILTAMDKTKMDYENASEIEQFVTRFLLRETINQLHSMQSSLECALEAVETQTKQERQDMKKTEPQRVVRRCSRRSHKSVCLPPEDAYPGILTTGVLVDGDTQWSMQINRLEQLIDKLECTQSPRLQPVKEDVTPSAGQMDILVVERKLSVAEGYMDQFNMSLSNYREFAAAQESCLHHLQTAQSKTFKRAIIDCLESPEHIKTMLFPAAWWVFEP
ncbi:N-terminal EF-hand calcium-binding protein 3 isoform X2 [Pseudophryne corroboree]|uniref:N-terminal EF-hand calcium-binding protein 3 isoform X2 n=1 Tax=Pseudophryne corroboree TaxID=495146 RepID=UPI0030818ADD